MWVKGNENNLKKYLHVFEEFFGIAHSCLIKKPKKLISYKSRKKN